MPAVRKAVHREEGVDPNITSGTRKYTALSWAQYQLRWQPNKRSRYHTAIVDYLSQLQSSTSQGSKRVSSEQETVNCTRAGTLPCARAGCSYAKHSTNTHNFCCDACKDNRGHGKSVCVRVYVFVYVFA